MAYQAIITGGNVSTVQDNLNTGLSDAGNITTVLGCANSYGNSKNRAGILVETDPNSPGSAYQVVVFAGSEDDNESAMNDWFQSNTNIKIVSASFDYANGKNRAMILYMRGSYNNTYQVEWFKDGTSSGLQDEINNFLETGETVEAFAYAWGNDQHRAYVIYTE